MEPMNIAVMVVGVFVVLASVVFVVLDMRKRKRHNLLITRKKCTDQYAEMVDETMVTVVTMLFDYMARTAMTLPNRSGRTLDEHETAMLPIQYSYEYKGKWPFALRVSNTATFKFHELDLVVTRTASPNDVVLSIDAPEANFTWSSLVGDDTALLSSLHNFERLMTKKEIPPDLSELLPKDTAWMARLAFISKDNFKWALLEAYNPGSAAETEDLQTYADHLRLLHVDLKNTLLTN